MKVKTINKVIKKKMEDWLSTITDEVLTIEVRENILLSGGSIASMLLKEDINDFDIYIQDHSVLLKLAKHYAKFNDLTVLDGNNREHYLGLLPPEENYTDKPYGNTSFMAVMYKSLHPGQVKLQIDGAGIAIANEDIEEQKAKGKKYFPIFYSQNAISLSDDIQIVLRFSGTAEQIHESFDFIHATNYWTYKDGLVTNIRALESLLTKELRYQGSKYPLTSVIRMKKFITRQWTINAGEILKMLFQISDLDLKNPVILEEQLIGVDIAYFSQLINIIRDTKPEKLTNSYLVQLIDKVFNNFDGDE
jgi:hypothetical protein